MTRAVSAAVLLVLVTSPPALTRAEDAATLTASVAGGAAAGATDATAALPGGYRVGDGVVSLVDWESTMGRVVSGDKGTVSGPGQAPNTLACTFSGVPDGVELPLAQLGNAAAVLNGGYRIGDRVASLIAWESNSADIARGDVGMVLDNGREDKGLVVSFPRMRRISILLTQVGKIGTPLSGDYNLGDKVVSLISWSGSAGSLAEGDVGLALASGNGGKGVVADFPNIKNLNIALHQISKAEVAKSASAPPQELQQEQVVQSETHTENHGQAAAQVGQERNDQEVRGSESAPVGSPAPAAAADGLSLAAGVGHGETQKESNGQAAAQVDQERKEQDQGGSDSAPAGVSSASAAAADGLALAEKDALAAGGPAGAAPGQTEAAASEEEKVSTKKVSSLSQKLADAERRASMGKKLQKAKANRDDSELETKPVKRHLLQADAWPADPKESLLQRLMGPLLGKKRPSDDEVAALSLAQTGVKIFKKSLLSGATRRHDEF